MLAQRNIARARSEERRDLVAHSDGHFPPALLPCAPSAFRPGIGVRAQALVDAAGHRTQRIADHVRAAVQDRKFFAPLQKWIHIRSQLRHATCCETKFSLYNAAEVVCEQTICLE